ncbi:cytochrome P450 4C1-like protein, partial [Leptotrombidium deliense]
MGLPPHVSPNGRKYIENIGIAQKKYLENMLFQFPFSHLMDNKIRKGKYLKQKFEELRAFGSKIIESRKKEFTKSKNESFLDNLLQLQKENLSLTDEEIRSQVHTFVAGAFDTTGTALQWLILLLGNHIEIQDNLRNEWCNFRCNK